MTSIETLAEDIFQLTVTQAVQSVFTTMLGLCPQPVPVAEESSPPPVDDNDLHIIGTAGLVGSINGVIYLDLELGFAKQCSARMLGMTTDELEAAGAEAVNDAVGELTNMTLGAFKNQLCDRGFTCRLTIPSIIRGRDFLVAPIKGGTRRIYHFEIDGHLIVADIVIGPAA